MKRVGLVALSSALFLFASAARADEPEPPPLPPPTGQVTTVAQTTVDTVHLRNGGMYRGRVSEIVPGDHVTMEVNGETKRIAWADVDRVIVASTPIPPAPTTPSATVTQAPLSGPKAHVHITSPKHAILYRRPTGSQSWLQACESPCDQELPIQDTYRVTGTGMTTSKEFHLDAPAGGAVDLVVDPPSVGGMVGGGVLLGGGAFIAYIASLVALSGAAAVSFDCDSTNQFSNSQCSSDRSARDGGLVVMGVSTAVAVLGLVVLLNAASTDVDQHGGGAEKPKSNDAFLRTPTFRTAEGGPAPATFPMIFEGHF